MRTMIIIIEDYPVLQNPYKCSVRIDLDNLSYVSKELRDKLILETIENMEKKILEEPRKSYPDPDRSDEDNTNPMII